MNLRKRTLALLLTLCLMFSVMVPLVSAEESNEIKIQVGTNYSANYAEIAKSVDTLVIDTTASYLRVQFKTAHHGTDWAAFRISGAQVDSGNYDLSLGTPGTIKNAGISEVYLLPNTTATGDALTTYITSNMTTANYVNTFESTGIKSLGTVALDGNDFILVFKSAAGQSGNKWLNLATVRLTPASGSTVTPPAGGESGGTVTPPAGGETGGTVTPPAGGESGGADTPAQTGDASPVLFAVMALAASLIAMVALIPGKKKI